MAARRFVSILALNAATAWAGHGLAHHGRDPFNVSNSSYGKAPAQASVRMAEIEAERMEMLEDRANIKRKSFKCARDKRIMAQETLRRRAADLLEVTKKKDVAVIKLQNAELLAKTKSRLAAVKAAKSLLANKSAEACFVQAEAKIAAVEAVLQQVADRMQVDQLTTEAEKAEAGEKLFVLSKSLDPVEGALGQGLKEAKKAAAKAADVKMLSDWLANHTKTTGNGTKVPQHVLDIVEDKQADAEEHASIAAEGVQKIRGAIYNLTHHIKQVHQEFDGIKDNATALALRKEAQEAFDKELRKFSRIARDRDAARKTACQDVNRAKEVTEEGGKKIARRRIKLRNLEKEVLMRKKRFETAQEDLKTLRKDEKAALTLLKMASSSHRSALNRHRRRFAERVVSDGKAIHRENRKAHAAAVAVARTLGVDRGAWMMEEP